MLGLLKKNFFLIQFFQKKINLHSNEYSQEFHYYLFAVK